MSRSHSIPLPAAQHPRRPPAAATRGILLLLLICASGAGCDAIAMGYRDKMDTFSPRPVLTDPKNIAQLETEARQALASWKDNDTDGNKLQVRDRIFDSVVRLSDAYFCEYDRALTRGRAYVDFVTDIATLFFTGGATIAGGKTDKTVLSGIATFLAGSKLAFDTDLYFKQTTPAISATMRALRAQKYNDLLQHKLNGATDYSKYTLADVERDLTEYYEAGTVYGAIADITKQAKVSEDDAKKAKDVILYSSRYVKDAASDALHKFWMPDGKTVNHDNELKLRQWMTENNLAAVPIPLFLYSPDYSQQRQQAVKKLIPPNQ